MSDVRTICRIYIPCDTTAGNDLAMEIRDTLGGTAEMGSLYRHASVDVSMDDLRRAVLALKNAEAMV